jgi:hypothetical protein
VGKEWWTCECKERVILKEGSELSVRVSLSKYLSMPMLLWEIWVPYIYGSFTLEVRISLICLIYSLITNAIIRRTGQCFLI